MKIIHYAPPVPEPEVEIMDWEKENSLEISVVESEPSVAFPRWKAYIYSLSIPEPFGMLVTRPKGEGQTVDEALENYGKMISRYKVVVNAHDELKTLVVPKLIHTKKVTE